MLIGLETSFSEHLRSCDLDKNWGRYSPNSVGGYTSTGCTPNVGVHPDELEAIHPLNTIRGKGRLLDLVTGLE